MVLFQNMKNKVCDYTLSTPFFSARCKRLDLCISMTHAYKLATCSNSSTPCHVCSCPSGSNNACLPNSFFVIMHTSSCFPGKLESLLLLWQKQILGREPCACKLSSGAGDHWPEYWFTAAVAQMESRSLHRQAHNGQWITDLPTTKKALGNTISTFQKGFGKHILKGSVNIIR